METIVFLSGWASAKEIWFNQREYFSKNYNVILENLTKNTLLELAEDVYQKFKLFQPINMISSSFGFIVALKILEMHPKAFKTLTGVGTNTNFSCIPKAKIFQMKRDLKKDYKNTLLEFYTMIFSENEKMQEDFKIILDSVTKHLHKYNLETLYAQLEILSTVDFTSHLVKINIPTLFVAGKEDPLIPLDNLKNLKERIRNCRLEIIKDAGHIPFLTKPDIFNQILDNFLKNQE